MRINLLDNNYLKFIHINIIGTYSHSDNNMLAYSYYSCGFYISYYIIY